MNLASHVLQRLLRLPPPTTRDLEVERDVAVPMRDGTVLLADRWTPAGGGAGLPVALFRSPYGRAAALWTRPLAERGYQVVIQSVRGTFGSQGAFEPYEHEREDGLDTLAWLTAQPWSGSAVVLVGASYLGYTQWSVADAVPEQVVAMVPAVTDSALPLGFARPDGFALETIFSWSVLVGRQERRFAQVAQLLSGPRVRRAMRTLPLEEADVVALGRRSEHFRDVLAHDADDPFWAPVDHRDRVGDVTVPVSSVAGWYDIFLTGQLGDFGVLQEHGRGPRLTVGPWTHTSVRGQGTVVTGEALGFGLAHAAGRAPEPRAPIRLFVMGEERWRDVDSWPPAGYVDQRFHLHPGGGLSPTAPASSAPDRFRYDPADPTPAYGGARLTGKAGRVDNRRLEARADVLTFTTEVLTEDVEVIGEVRAEIYFASSLAHADVFVRLCDVDARGRSWNVCDGLTTAEVTQGPGLVRVAMAATAQRFLRGHRIRVQVSSGAFPVYGRNPGLGEPRATATTLRAAEQRVFHDPEHPSAVLLPVRRADS